MINPDIFNKYDLTKIHTHNINTNLNDFKIFILEQGIYKWS